MSQRNEDPRCLREYEIWTSKSGTVRHRCKLLAAHTGSHKCVEVESTGKLCDFTWKK